MRKLLAVLGSIGLFASTGVTSVVSCNPDKKDDNNNNNNNDNDKISMDDIIGVKPVDGIYKFEISVAENFISKTINFNGKDIENTSYGTYHEGQYLDLFFAIRATKVPLDSALQDSIKNMENYFDDNIEYGQLIETPDSGNPIAFTDFEINSELSDEFNIKEGVYKFSPTIVLNNDL